VVQNVLCAVANAQWLHLKHLDLSGRHHELGSHDVLCLTRGHWPGLSPIVTEWELASV